MKKALFLLVLSLSCVVNLMASQAMRNITIYDGLAGESVYKIFKSRWGVIWVATTNGVSSYDGYKVRTYRIGAKRSLNRIYDIAQADDGFIWVAAENGLYKVDGSKQWLDRAMPEINEPVSCIRIIGDRIYAGTKNGIYVGSTRKGKPSLRHVWLTANHISSWNHVQDMAFDGKNRLYAVTQKDIFWIDVKTGRVGSAGLSKRDMLKMNFSHIGYAGGKLYVGTANDGLFVYDIKVGELRKSVGLGCNIITCISADSSNLYVGTDGGGLAVIDLRTEKLLKTYSNSSDSEFQLLDNTVYSYYHDPSGVNFFGYFRQGLHYNYFVKPLFRHYAFRDFDSRNINVRSICIDGKVKVLGSRGGLYFVDEGRGIVKFFSPAELGGSIVTNVVKYCGMYYCCTFNGGVMRIDPQTLTTSRFGQSDELRNGSFGDLEVSPDNELWMSGTGGVYIYNAHTDKERHFDAANSILPNVYCNDLLFDRVGRCWISTAEGLFIYDPADRRIHRDGFPNDFFHLQKETHGAWGDRENLLFYCNDGLYVTNEELTDYHQVEGFDPSRNDYIAQVKYDKRSRNLWIASEKGLFCADPSMKSIRKFSSESGLDSKEFSYNAIQIDEEGTLWTGTMDGLYYAKLSEAGKYSMSDADILLNEVQLDDTPMGDEGIVSLVRNHSLQLGYNWRCATLSFIPVLLNYCNQEGLAFEYRILKRDMGKDDGWVQQKLNERIALSDLSLGMNTLQIRLSGEDKSVDYQIYVVPTGWLFIEIVCIVIFFVAVYLAYRQRRMVLMQREEMLRVQRELEEAKRKYSRVTTSSSQQEMLRLRLDEYMKAEKPYLQHDLKLSDVAAHFGISTVKLSQLFSVHLQTNYYDYVNNYRLQEFKSRARQPQYKKYTLLALAEECGFKRSSFFATFKRVDGITPTEYMKSLT